MKEKECCKIIAWLQIAWTQKGKWLNSRNDKGQISQKLIQLNQTWEPIGGRRKTPQKSCQEAIEATSNIHRDFSENKLACKSLRVKPIVSKKISCSVYGENVEAIKSDVSELKVNVSMVQKQLDCQQNCTEDLDTKCPQCGTHSHDGFRKDLHCAAAHFLNACPYLTSLSMTLQQRLLSWCCVLSWAFSKQGRQNSQRAECWISSSVLLLMAALAAVAAATSTVLLSEPFPSKPNDYRQQRILAKTTR